jgi:hypothetical protein
MRTGLLSLKEITGRLLHAESYGEIRQAAADMHALFSGIAEINGDFRHADRNETLLSQGKAISPYDAAQCILDFARTREFLSGVRAAIIEAQKRFPGQKIHVLYAGCGPFATLALPLTTEFTAEQVQFTLLDIHRRSLDAARLIVETLGVSAYVREYVECDAASYRCANGDAPHIVLTETMQSALEKEPHVAITSNLAPQLREGGILIPRKITLNACLAEVSKEFEVATADETVSITQAPRRSRVELGEVFELTAESARQIRDWATTNVHDGACAARRSPTVKLRAPQLVNGNHQLMILTKITIFDSITLGDYDCGLTLPNIIDEFGNIGSHQQLEFCYVTGEKPGLRCRLI